MQHLRCYTLSAPTSIESSLQLETRVAGKNQISMF